MNLSIKIVLITLFSIFLILILFLFYILYLIIYVKKEMDKSKSNYENLKHPKFYD
jgi:hypothetical protein